MTDTTQVPDAGQIDPSTLDEASKTQTVTLTLTLGDLIAIQSSCAAHMMIVSAVGGSDEVRDQATLATTLTSDALMSVLASLGLASEGLAEVTQAPTQAAA